MATDAPLRWTPARRADAVRTVVVRDLTNEGVRYWNEQGRSDGFIILRQQPRVPPTYDQLTAFADRLGEIRQPVIGLPRRPSQIHEVRPTLEGSVDDRGVLILSTTYQRIPLHTDGYNADDPPRIVVLQVVRPGQRSVSTFHRADTIVRVLSASAISHLMLPVFPVIRGTVPILTHTENDAEVGWHIRINLHEIGHHLHRGTNVDLLQDGHHRSIDELRGVLSRAATDRSSQARLAAGDVVVLDNRRTLHGRSRLSRTEHDRLLHRVWIR